jgi:predicted XRE-type DNA-binding protein
MRSNRLDSQFRASSGNVFKDLNVAEPDKELVKVGLVRAICAIVSDRRLKQIDVAARLDIAQPKVSLLLRGRTAGFSTDALMRFLNRLGQSIDIVVKPGGSANRPNGKTRVQFEPLSHVPRRTGAHGVSRSTSSPRMLGAVMRGKPRQVARARAAKKK